MKEIRANKSLQTVIDEIIYTRKTEQEDRLMLWMGIDIVIISVLTLSLLAGVWSAI